MVAPPLKMAVPHQSERPVDTLWCHTQQTWLTFPEGKNTGIYTSYTHNLFPRRETQQHHTWIASQNKQFLV